MARGTTSERRHLRMRRASMPPSPCPPRKSSSGLRVLAVRPRCGGGGSRAGCRRVGCRGRVGLAVGLRPSPRMWRHGRPSRAIRSWQGRPDCVAGCAPRAYAYPAGEECREPLCSRWDRLRACRRFTAAAVRVKPHIRSRRIPTPRELFFERRGRGAVSGDHTARPHLCCATRPAA
jgi:hypothetical protein